MKKCFLFLTTLAAHAGICFINLGHSEWDREKHQSSFNLFVCFFLIDNHDEVFSVSESFCSCWNNESFITLLKWWQPLFYRRVVTSWNLVYLLLLTKPLLWGFYSESPFLCQHVQVFSSLSPLSGSGHVVLCWSPLSIWSRVLWRVRNMYLFSLTRTICWRCCLFFSV